MLRTTFLHWLSMASANISLLLFRATPFHTDRHFGIYAKQRRIPKLSFNGLTIPYSFSLKEGLNHDKYVPSCSRALEELSDPNDSDKAGVESFLKISRFDTDVSECLHDPKKALSYQTGKWGGQSF